MLDQRAGLAFAPATETTVNSWSVLQNGQILELHYGVGRNSQFGALHTDSSFLRLNYGKDFGWGSSIILLPSFWIARTYYQGAPVEAVCRSDGTNLVIWITGRIATLVVEAQINLLRPEPNLTSGTVVARVYGDIDLDHRPGEAFKPVALSSMHISETQWDASAAQVDSQTFPIPTDGWIVRPPAFGRRFALIAGSSLWKANAPTVEIVLKEQRQIAGWKTLSSNPNDDNVSLWTATDEVLRSWQYTFNVRDYMMRRKQYEQPQ
jgi:hypothetical protein